MKWKGRYGVLLEVRGCYSGTHGVLMQTAIVATAWLSAIETYGGLKGE